MLASVLFSDISISEGSVATHLKYGGMFYNSVARNLLLSIPVKYFENRSAFDKLRKPASACATNISYLLATR